MRHRICWGMIAALGLVSAGVDAQTPRQRMIAENYDTSKPFTFEGLLWGQATLRPPASVYLLVKNEDSKGKTEEWAVEGDSIDKMRVAGYSDDIVKMGAIISVRGFRAKPGVNVADTIAGPRRGALERVMDLAKAGRIMYGTQITLADGKKVPFGSAAGWPLGFRREPPNSPRRLH
jgi:Family of unknown function (DUF6152)